MLDDGPALGMVMVGLVWGQFGDPVEPRWSSRGGEIRCEQQDPAV